MATEVVDIPFVGPAYESASKIISAQESLNVFPEVNSRSSKSRVMLPRPGREAYASSAGNPRLLWAMGGVLFGVTGTSAIRIEGGAVTALGTIEDGTRMGVAHNGSTALICNGDKQYQVDYWGVTEITDEDCPSGSVVAYQNGYWIKTAEGSNQFRVSSIDNPSAWSSLDNAFDRQVPGNIVGLASDHGELVVFKDSSISFWYENGAATGIPFARVPQLFLETGAVNAQTIVTGIAERLIFLGRDEDATLAVFSMAGRQVQRISTPAVDYQIAQYANPSEAYAFKASMAGHPLYVIRFPGVATWAYDASINEWHQWQSYGLPDYDATHCALSGSDLYVMKDDGAVSRLSLTLYQDDGNPIIYRRVSAPYERQGRPFCMDWLELDCETGSASIDTSAVVSLELSRDGGRTWSSPRNASLGAAGDTHRRVKWTGLGMARDVVFRITQADGTRPVWTGLRAGIRTGR